MRVKLHELRTVIRDILEEAGISYGPNWQTLDNMPVNWADYPGVEVDSYPDVNGGHWIEINVPADESLSLPLRLFKTQEDAEAYGRSHTDEIKRKLMNMPDSPAETINFINIDSANYIPSTPLVKKD